MLPRSIIQGQTNLKRFVYKRVPLLEDTLKKKSVFVSIFVALKLFPALPSISILYAQSVLPTLSPNPSHTLSFYLVPDLFHELSVVVLKSPINMFSLFAFNHHHALLLLLPSPQSEHSLCHIFVPPNQKKILGPGRASF